MLTQARVRELFGYHPDGYLIWKVSLGRRVHVGDVAGTKNGQGYFQVQIDGKQYQLHRVIFLWHHGWLPKEVDHKDTDTSHNWIDNLRPAARHQNQQNLSKLSSNKSGYKGVSWNKQRNKWVAVIRSNGVRNHLGSFSTPQAAHTAYCVAGKKFHGEFFNAG